MKVSFAARIAVLSVLGLSAAACANTIRGVGQDTANTVNAAQSAGNNVAKATK